MPIIPQVSQSIKMGKTSSRGMPAKPSATIDAISQAQVASSSLQPIPFLPGVLPVIPFGIALSITMTKIEAMMFKSFEDLSKLSQSLMQKYEAEKTKAENQRRISADKLYSDLQDRQQEIKDELKDLQAEYDTNSKTIPELQAKQESEMKKYNNVIFEIRNKAKIAETEGNIIERDRLLESISIHDNWLAEIIKISVEIITIELRQTPLKREIDEKKELASMTIPNDWDQDVELADLFEVAVPPYPDLPLSPELPNTPPIPKESEFIKAMRKAYTKWVVTPTILPLGIPLCATLLYIQSMSTASPKLAAKLESSADVSILQGAGLI